MCTLSGQEMKENFFSQNFNLRDADTYENQCNVLTDPGLQRNRGYWSKMYGINRRSILCALRDFPVTQKYNTGPYALSP